MVNYLGLTETPTAKYEFFFEVIRDFRKGGLSPSNYEEFLNTVKSLPPILNRKPSDYNVFSKFGLIDLSEEDFPAVMREAQRRSAEKSKMCWHPLAGSSTCKLGSNGEIIISAAHSLQNNGVLSKIMKDGHVTTFARDTTKMDGKLLSKNVASVFWGFCNKHDAIFKPIETVSYTETIEQNFLFAYRSFTVAAHKKNEGSNLFDFGDQADNDIIETKKIFDEAILSGNMDILDTTVVQFPLFYPVAAASSFYLDFDFEGNEISHSDERMENIFITLVPDASGSYLIVSYFKRDAHLYENFVKQLVERNNLKSDVSILLAAHTENIYFEPVYFSTFIENQGEEIKSAMKDSQFDYAYFDENNQRVDSFSLTPVNYLSNPFSINLFGY